MLRNLALVQPINYHSLLHIFEEYYCVGPETTQILDQITGFLSIHYAFTCSVGIARCDIAIISVFCLFSPVQIFCIYDISQAQYTDILPNSTISCEVAEACKLIMLRF